VSTNRVDVGDWLLETTELLEWNGSKGETEKAVLPESGGGQVISEVGGFFGKSEYH